MSEEKMAVYSSLIKWKRNQTDWENPEEVKEYYEFTKQVRKAL